MCTQHIHAYTRMQIHVCIHKHSRTLTFLHAEYPVCSTLQWKISNNSELLIVCLLLEFHVGLKRRYQPSCIRLCSRTRKFCTVSRRLYRLLKRLQLIITIKHYECDIPGLWKSLTQLWTLPSTLNKQLSAAELYEFSGLLEWEIASDNSDCLLGPIICLCWILQGQVPSKCSNRTFCLTCIHMCLRAKFFYIMNILFINYTYILPRETLLKTTRISQRDYY